MIRVGIDAGGTFTDCVAIVDGALRAHKLRSRPEDPAAVVDEALRALVPADSPAEVELVFSTTAGTNALLERTGGPVYLVTTAGFEDVLEIGRQARPALYALHPVVPAPLVPAADRIGVNERTAVDGTVLVPLAPAAIVAVLGELAARAPARVALTLLHGHAHPGHEQRLAEALRARGLEVSVSSEVCPLPREYERTSTTVIDAYVAPRLGSTLARLRRPGLRLRVMESTGGAEGEGAVRPVRTVLSGPAAGLVAIAGLLGRRGLARALALDVGGTSTDVALLEDGAARRVEERAIGGAVIALPSLAVDSVGAGGGSVAWLDEGGALRLGPRSAGAVPGPAAYGQGGDEPTLTDAHVVLGRLGGRLAGGAIELDTSRAAEAIAWIAEPLATSVEAAAAAIVAVGDAVIARALRAASGSAPVEALVAYGGAAGLHAVAVARELGIARVLVPTMPGLQCARGALAAPIVVERLLACDEVLASAPSGALGLRAAALRVEVEAALLAQGEPGGELATTARLRYEGQGPDAELELPLAELTPARFVEAYAQERGHRLDRPIVVTRLCVRGTVEREPVPTAFSPAVGWPRRGARTVEGEPVPVYRRERLPAARALAGPAIVEELSATLWLPRGARLAVAGDGVLEIEV